MYTTSSMSSGKFSCRFQREMGFLRSKPAGSSPTSWLPATNRQDPPGLPSQKMGRRGNQEGCHSFGSRDITHDGSLRGLRWYRGGALSRLLAQADRAVPAPAATGRPGRRDLPMTNRRRMSACPSKERQLKFHQKMCKTSHFFPPEHAFRACSGVRRSNCLQSSQFMGRAAAP